MSTQEERFAQIAAAIREKDGTTAPIKALDFAARIRAISTQGGGGTDGATILENWNMNENRYTGSVRMAGESLLLCPLEIEILEGYS